MTTRTSSRLGLSYHQVCINYSVETSFKIQKCVIIIIGIDHKKMVIFGHLYQQNNIHIMHPYENK